MNDENTFIDDSVTINGRSTDEKEQDKKQAKLEGNSIGILNVQKRIKLLCGPKYGLSYMENETGGVTARLLLPHEEDAK